MSIICVYNEIIGNSLSSCDENTSVREILQRGKFVSLSKPNHINLSNNINYLVTDIQHLMDLRKYSVDYRFPAGEITQYHFCYRNMENVVLFNNTYTSSELIPVDIFSCYTIVSPELPYVLQKGSNLNDYMYYRYTLDEMQYEASIKLDKYMQNKKCYNKFENNTILQYDELQNKGLYFLVNNGIRYIVQPTIECAKAYMEFAMGNPDWVYPSPNVIQNIMKKHLTLVPIKGINYDRFSVVDEIKTQEIKLDLL